MAPARKASPFDDPGGEPYTASVSDPGSSADASTGAGERLSGELARLRKVARAWLPLAASWLLMGLELPAVSAVVARLADPQVELAAYGSVILPIALIIESPIIMLLSASTALSRDRASYRELARFCHRSSALLTAIHAVIAVTPLYPVVVGGLLGAPESVLDAARPGLIIMTPWTWAIAYRRFNQGVLIRFGHPRAVTVGTGVRLVCNLAVLTLGWFVLELPGATLAATAVAVGVVAEAVYSGLRVRPVVAGHLVHDDPQHTPLRGRAFFGFYVPLAMTAVVGLLAQPLASAGVARMPESLASLAVLPVIHGLVFLFQTQGLAMTEVVVAGLERPGSGPTLRRFARLLAAILALWMVLFALTPLVTLWFGAVSGLAGSLVDLGRAALLFAVFTPALRPLQSWYEGVLVHARATRAISEAVVISLLTTGLTLAIGIAVQRWPGLVVAMGAQTLGRAAQVAWLRFRSRRQIAEVVEGPI